MLRRRPFSTLARAERAIRDQTEGETLVVFDARGRYVFHRSEPGRLIVVSTDELRRMNGCTVTHNHPGGGTFSVEDVETACKGEVHEMRVVTAQFTYRMQPPPAGWNGAFWQNVLEPVRVRLEIEVGNALFALLTAGVLREGNYLEEYAHQSWGRVADELGFSYVRKPRP